MKQCEPDMPQYRFKAYARDGRIESGQMTARSASHVVELLNAKGLVTFEAKEESGGSKAAPSKAFFGLTRTSSPAELARFIKEMATLLKADLPIDQIMKIMLSQSLPAPMRAVATGVSASLSEGLPLSEGLANHANALPAYSVSLIRAGEARGNLAEAMHEVSTLLERQLLLRNKVRSALIYPALMAATATAVFAIVVMYLVPSLMPLFRDAGVSPPMALTIADGIATSIAKNWQFVLIAFICAMVGGRGLLKSPAVRTLLDHVRLAIPVFGPVNRNASFAIFARTLGTLLRSGVAVVPALKATADTASNSVLASSLRTVSERVHEGEQLSAALEKTGQMPALAVRFVSVGESASRLDHMLLQLADVLENETELKIDRAMVLLTPVLTITIGVLVGGLILSVMQAILSVNQLAVR
jgi:general secretion pathway protein F